MDRYEYNVRLEQIRSLSDNQEFHEAMVIADSIDWRKVRSVRTLSFISEIYKINRRYEEAKDILLIADARCPNARSIVYALCELSIRMGDLNDSVGYLKEYMELAPSDPSTFVLQYKFYDLTNVGLQQRIEILEQLKNVDYQERWGYELAKLYSDAGETKKCVEECDRLILWFGHGRYVTKAMELKMLYEELTPEQQHKYEHQDALEVLAGAENLSKEEKEPEEEKRPPLSIEISNIQPSNQPTNRIPDKEIKDRLGVEDIKEPSVNVDKYSTMNLQAELKQNMADLEKKTGEPLREKEISLPPLEKIAPVKVDRELKEITNIADDDILSNRVSLNIGRRGETDVEKEFARILSEDYDGQMSLNVPGESSTDEKQITGQISIEDILSGRLNRKKAAVLPDMSDMGRPSPVRPAAPVPVKPAAPVAQEMPAVPAPAEPAAPVAAQKIPAAPAPEKPAAPVTRIPSVSRITPVVPVVSEENVAPAEDKVPEGGVKNETHAVRREMKRETLAVTSDLTGLLREHRERVNARLKKSNKEPEPETEELPADEAEEDGKEKVPEETGRLPDISSRRKKKETEKYVAPEVPEVRGFDEEEKEIFAQFLPMHDLPELIRDTLNRMKLNGKNGNVFITGNEQSARISLANALARGYMHEHPDDFVGKVAKIPADLFNTKNVPDVLSALDGCALVIEHAADLTDASLEDIRKVLTKPDTSIILILEETKSSFRILERNHRKDWFDQVFDVKIEIPTYTNDDLVFHGREYAREQEYIIDDMGVLALYTKIDERQTADHFVTIDEVEEIVDDAIRHVNRKTPGHFLDVVVGKRYDDDDMIILREKDFV